MGPEGARAIANALLRNHALVELDLGSFLRMLMVRMQPAGGSGCEDDGRCVGEKSCARLFGNLYYGEATSGRQERDRRRGRKGGIERTAAEPHAS